MLSYDLLFVNICKFHYDLFAAIILNMYLCKIIIRQEILTNS